jgi:hypothetical protein
MENGFLKSESCRMCNLKMEVVFSSETLSKFIPNNRVSHHKRLYCTQSSLWWPPDFTRSSSSKRIYVGKLIRAKRCNWEKFFSLTMSFALNFQQFWTTEPYNHWSMRETRCQNKSHLCNKNTISVVLVQDEHFICHITIVCTE